MKNFIQVLFKVCSVLLTVISLLFLVHSWELDRKAADGARELAGHLCCCRKKNGAC